MPDVRIVSKADLQGTVADWLLLPGGALDESEELANYVKVALMTDRLSGEFDLRPDPDSDDRRGWWGDLDANAVWRGWPVGCKNWLLTRTKITGASAAVGDTAVRAENYCRDALQPLIDLKLCSVIDVQARRVELERIDVSIIVYRGPQAEIELVFQDLWSLIAGG